MSMVDMYLSYNEAIHMDEEKNTTLSSTPEDGKNTGTTPNGNSSTQDGGKQTDEYDNKSKFIPRERFDEVISKKNELEARLAQYEADEKERNDAEALKRGEHESIIAARDEEIAELKSQLANTEKLATTLKTISDNHLESFKGAYGEDAYTQALALIRSQDPLVILETLPTIEAVFKDKKKPIPSGGSQQPGGATQIDRLADYQDRLNKGETLGSREKEDYLKLVLGTK